MKATFAAIFLALLSSLAAGGQSVKHEPKLIADKTYDGQADMLSSMPTHFDATGSFQTSRITALCPEAKKYVKVFDGEFLTPVDQIDAYLHSARTDLNEMGEKILQFHIDNKICLALDKGETVSIVGVQMSIEGCKKAWAPIEYSLKYPRTSSYACFYNPLIIVDGKRYMVPSVHLIGFDQWAAGAWQLHK